jgi:hypothetical protein
LDTDRFVNQGELPILDRAALAREVAAWQALPGWQRLERKMADEWPFWDAPRFARALERYLRWLALVKATDALGIALAPTVEIDTVWHQHILDTAFYREFCATALGIGFVDHDPYLGQPDEREGPEAAGQAQAQARAIQAFTQRLWEHVWGTPYFGA